MVELSSEEIITIIKVEDKNLIIFYSKGQDGTWQHFENDADMYDYIKNNPTQASDYFLCKKDKETYWLNITSTQNFGYFKWGGSPECLTLLKAQLDIFGPIIDNFIMHVKFAQE